MRNYIVEQMSKGVSLEDIHIEVERMFNEEYNKREREQKEAQIEAAFDRAAQAFTDYLNLIGEEGLDVDTVKIALRMAEMSTYGRTKAKECAAVRPMMPRVEVIKAEDNSDADDEVLMKFLSDMGLIRIP